jgi:hypothetical protein
MRALARPARLADFARLQAEQLQEEMEELEGDWKLQVGAAAAAAAAAAKAAALWVECLPV